MKIVLSSFACIVGCLSLASTGWSQDGTPSTSGPVLAHEPVAVAMSDEPINVLTRVAAVRAPIRSVTLNYSLSKDGSPVSVEMAASSEGVYMGTIPNDHFKSARSVWYYIEAVDESDEWAETSWHQILVKRPGTPAPPAFVPPAAVTAPSQPATPSTGRAPVEYEEDGGLGTPALVIGGAVLIGGGAIAAIAASGGSSSGGGDSEPTTTDDPTTPDPDGPTQSVGLMCEVADVAGTWNGTDPEAPGFSLFSNQSASFSFRDGETEAGSWSLTSEGCFIALSPSGTNTLYRGTGDVRTEGIPFSVSINGRTFTKSN